MATKTQKIPTSSWGQHKDTILRLYLSEDYSVDKLVQQMAQDHGFLATISQYEAQLRLWNARKNVKRHEWEGIFKKIDLLSANKAEYRVVISGYPLPLSRVNRARRYFRNECQSRKRPRTDTEPSDAINGRDLSDVYIEIKDSSGAWSRYTNMDHEVASLGTLQQNPDRPPDPKTHDPLITIDGHTWSISDRHSTPEYLDGIDPIMVDCVPPPTPEFRTPRFLSNSWVSAGIDENLTPAMNPLPNNFESEVSRSSDLFDPNQGITFPAPEATPSLSPDNLFVFETSQLLNGLPSGQFTRDMVVKWFSFGASPSPMRDFALFAGTQKLAIFVTEIATAISELNMLLPTQNLQSAWRFLQNLVSIVPRSQAGYCTDMTRYSQELLDAEIPRLLLISCANGFIGRYGVPRKYIFRFLNQHGNVTSLLSRLFQDSSSHLGKSLAENLFWAAIEAGDDRAVQFFLEKGLANADNTFCLFANKRCSPLQRAAELQELKVVRVLLRYAHNPDGVCTIPNFSPAITALGHLICQDLDSHYGRTTLLDHSVFSKEYLDTVKALVEAGARIMTSHIRIALANYARPDLAKLLLSKLSRDDHPEAMAGVILPHVASEFTDEDAKAVIAKLISDCEQVECKQCLNRFSENMNKTIILGAKRGHIQLVRFLFQYATSPTRVLSAAIRSGSSELIEFVLSHNPNIRQAHAEGIEDNCLLVEDPYTNKMTTPLAEAIMARDETLIKILENRGALENFAVDIEPPIYMRRNPFQAALLAAVNAGNTEYVKKLLLYEVPNNHPQLGVVYETAIRDGHEAIIRLLLDMGCIFSPRRSICDISIFRDIDKTIILDLILTYPDIMLYYGESNTGIKLPEDMDIISTFHEHGCIPVETLARLLSAAARQNERDTCLRLIQMGAPMIRGTALEGAEGFPPDILRGLLDQLPLTQTRMGWFGTEAVKRALTHDNLENLDILLACRAIDFKQPGVIRLAIKKDMRNHRSNFQLTAKFLNAGFDVDGIADTCQTSNGKHSNMTPLLIAIKARNEALIQFFLDRGADVNKKATYGIMKTPLQAAARVGDLEIVEMLLRNGADVNALPSTYDGGTALQLAAASGNCNIAAILIDRGADLYAPPSTYGGRWPLEYAAKYGRLDMIQFLWNASLVGFPVEQCRKAMQLAQGNGYLACMDMVRELAVSSGIMPTLEGSS